MLENVGNACGYRANCQSPKKPFPETIRKTPLDQMRDVVALERAEKIANRINELKSKPANERTTAEKFELGYYSALKTIANMNQFNTVVH